MSYRKIFNGGINADDDFSAHAKGQWINASGVRTFTTDNGATARHEAIGGTALLFNTLPSGTNLCIGGCEDEARKFILWCNWNSNGDHGIYAWDKLNAVGYKVLLNADVIGGFNFSKEAYIHSCFIASGTFYWVNGTQNQPRRINYESGIKAYQSGFTTTAVPYILPVSQSVISWIRKPPAFTPLIRKAYQTTPPVEFNSIADGAFQFCYRYNFRGFEFSTLSPLSLLANYNSADDLFNRIDISIPFTEQIEQDVLSIDLVVRFLDTNSYFLLKNWSRDVADESAQIDSHNSGTTPLTYGFYNDLAGEALDSAYKVKPFDSFPTFVNAAELAKNRAFIANYTEGMDTPGTTSLTVSFTPVNVGTTVVTTIIGEWYKLYFRLTDTGVSGLINLDFDYYIIQTTTPFDIPLTPAPVYYWIVTANDPTIQPSPYPTTLVDTDLTFVGSTLPELLTYFWNNVSHTPPYPLFTPTKVSLVDQFTDSAISTAGSTSSLLSKAFKSAASYEVAVDFYDLYLRNCGVKKMTGRIIITTIVDPADYSVTSTAPHTITIAGIDGSDVLPGDILSLIPTVGGPSLIAGDYVISTATNGGGSWIFTVPDTIITTSALSTYLQIFRKTPGGSAIAIPDSKLTDDYVPYINWALDNTNALNEIPDRAYYYSINVTKCLTTRFFMDGAGFATYLQKDDTGLYTLVAPYSTDLSGIGVDVTSLESFNMGYTFNVGDICKFVISGTEYILPITGTTGKYIILELKNVGTLSPTNVVFEILTPYKKEITEPFFEIGALLPVLNPTLSSRSYTYLTGTIGGDIYLFKRSFSTATFIAEAMNINDKYWQNWFTDAGRPNFVDTIGETMSPGGRRFSNTFIEGAKVNGLSSFEALNADAIDSENGAINKLQLANKVQADGTVILNICVNENVSTYIGEQELLDTQGSAYIAKSDSVIGTSKALKGSMGTSNPESVFENNGQVYYYDIRNACWVQYSNNGLFAFSKNKFVRPTKLFSKKFASLTTAEIETLGSRPYVIGGYDPYHKEALFSIPSTEATPPKGYLEDYSDPQIIYPYDIYDGRGKTLIYKHLADDSELWIGSIPIEVEKFIKMDNDLYGFKNGALYIFNQPNLCNFFGVQYTAKLMYSNNPAGISTFTAIGLECNKLPLFIHLRTEDPYVQSSDLPYSGVRDLVSKQGVIESSLLRDRLSPNSAGNYDAVELIGDKLYGKALLVMLEWEFVEDTTPLQLRAADIGFTTNTGSIINQK